MPLKPDHTHPNTCKECAEPTGKPNGVKFCSKACGKAFNNRRMTRGALIYDLAMTMRKDRETGAFGNLCHQIGLFLAADREEGRVSHNDYRDEPIPYQIPTTKRKD